MADGLPHPFGIAVHGEHVYWTDRKLDAILMANKETGEGVTTVRQNLEDLMDIHMFHRHRRTGMKSQVLGHELSIYNTLSCVFCGCTVRCTVASTAEVYLMLILKVLNF